LNQRRAFTQIQMVRPVFETEGGIGRQAHDCSVGKSQFSRVLLVATVFASTTFNNARRAAVFGCSIARNCLRA
jgi:hypothetical protein